MTQILECGRTLAGGFVAFHLDWEGGLTAGPIVWSMEISNPDSAETVRLGHLRVDGAFSEQFVEDRQTGRRQPVEEDADLGEGQITVRFPANVVGVAVEWPIWRAVITVDGSDVADRVAAL